MKIHESHWSIKTRSGWLSGVRGRRSVHSYGVWKMWKTTAVILQVWLFAPHSDSVIKIKGHLFINLTPRDLLDGHMRFPPAIPPQAAFLLVLWLLTTVQKHASGPLEVLNCSKVRVQWVYSNLSNGETGMDSNTPWPRLALRRICFGTWGRKPLCIIFFSWLNQL